MLDEAIALGLCDKVWSDCCPAHAQIELERRVLETSRRKCTRRVVARLMVGNFWPFQGSDANGKRKREVVSLAQFFGHPKLSSGVANKFWSHSKTILTLIQ